MGRKENGGRVACAEEDLIRATGPFATPETQLEHRKVVGRRIACPREREAAGRFKTALLSELHFSG